MHSNSSILLITGDQCLNNVLTEHLEDEKKFNVFCLPSDLSVLEILETKQIELIIYDQSSCEKGLNSYFFNHSGNFIEIPIIVLIDESIEIEASYHLFLKREVILKPFRFEELASKVYFMLADAAGSTPATLFVGEYRFEKKHKSFVNKTGQTVILTEKEASILEYLNNNPDRSISKEELLLNIWGYREDLETRTLETHIYRLRKKIQELNKNCEILFFEKGGYILKL